MGSSGLSKALHSMISCRYCSAKHPPPCTLFFTLHAAIVTVTERIWFRLLLLWLLYLAKYGSGKKKIGYGIFVGDGYFFLLRGTFPNMSAILLVPLWIRKACNQCTEVTDE